MLKTSNSLRAMQIVIGAITLVLAGVVLAFPAFAMFLIAIWLSLSLLFGGIQGVVMGIGAAHMSRGWRAIGIAIGAIAIGLSVAVIAFPAAAVLTSVLLLSIGLLFLGWGGIASGLSEKRMPGWARAMLVIVGAITVGLAIPVWVFPAFGTSVLYMLIATALIINGASYIIAGATGAMIRPLRLGLRRNARRSWESDAA